jgi:acyl carrier protein
MNQKIKNIMETAFNVDLTSVRDSDLDPGHIKAWDSLSHLALITCLEEEFNVEIRPERIAGMTSLQAIVAVLRELGVS